MLLTLSLLRRVLLAPVADEPSAARASSVRIERMVRQHADSAWRTARDLGVAPRDLEDVVQEVMLVVVRRLSDIEEQKERAFVLATAARIAANWRRGRRRRPLEYTEAIEDASAACQSRSLRDNPEQCLEHARQLALLRLALAAMPEPQRVAFILFELEQLTAKEIAEELKIGEAAVFSRVRRAWGVFRRVCEQSAGALGREDEQHG